VEELLFNYPEASEEIFTPNSWYGSSFALRTYAHWPWPLPFILPHGVILSSSFVWEAEAACKLNEVYAFPHYREKAYERGSRIKPLKGASPWLYLLESGHNRRPKTIKTLAFPAHSTHHVRVRTDDEAYACHLAGMDERKGSVAVCMYWRDIQIGRHRTFLRKGLRVLSAGHIFDSMFFERLLYILKHAEMVHSPSLGSHLFYAAAAGCTVCYEPRWAASYSARGDVTSRDISHVNEDILANITQMFAAGVPPDVQRVFAEEFLGKRNLKTRAFLFYTIANSAMRCRAWWIQIIINNTRSKRQSERKNLSAAAFEVLPDDAICFVALS
jgi:hypothetical protein